MEVFISLLRAAVEGDPRQDLLNWQWDYQYELEGIIPIKGNLLEFASAEELCRLLGAMEAVKRDACTAVQAALFLTIARQGRPGSEELPQEKLAALKDFFLWGWRIFCGVLPALSGTGVLAGTEVEFLPDRIVVRPPKKVVGLLVGKGGKNVKKINAFFSALGKRVILVP